MKRADSLIRRTASTRRRRSSSPANYRFGELSVGSIEQVIPLLKFLVEKEAARSDAVANRR